MHFFKQQIFMCELLPAAVAKDAEVSTSTPQDYRAASLRYETWTYSQHSIIKRSEVNRS